MSTPINQPTAAPTSKVAAAGIGGAITVVLIYLAQTFFNIDLPAEVGGAVAVIVSFFSGYIVKERV